MRVPLIGFKTIHWDNGREIGILGNRTLYFNGLSRKLDSVNQQLKINNQPWQWHQTFGFDSAQGRNGDLAVLSPAARTIEAAMDISKCGGQPMFLKLEIVDDQNQGADLWIRHPDSRVVSFRPDSNALLWTALLPQHIGNKISKVQFCGQLDNLEMVIRHVDVIA